MMIIGMMIFFVLGLSELVDKSKINAFPTIFLELPNLVCQVVENLSGAPAMPRKCFPRKREGRLC